MTPTIELESVRMEFSTGWGSGRRTVTAMNDVSFTIEPGETLGLVGESGSGKSTTAAVALGLQQPHAGTIRFQGEPLSRKLRSRAGRVQAVLQHPQWALDPRMRVIDSVREPLRLRRVDDHHRGDRQALDMLAAVGLTPEFAGRRPHQLSGGQRQRVSVARALITRPAFIVFDEAVSALDVSVQAQILNLITDLQAEHGFSALFISHDLAAVRYLSHRVAVMRRGEIVELAPTSAFYDVPSHPYSQMLFRELPT